MPEIVSLPAGYKSWLAELKARIHQARQRAALAVNSELVLLYWQIGRDILDRQDREGWGTKVIERLAQDLRSAFPHMKGLSRTNLLYMRAFAEAWPDFQIVQQAVGLLPWGHNLILLTKLKATDQRLAYARRAIEHGWSRNTLVSRIESRLLDREGQALTNFAQQLPKAQSDLARESFKDPYVFDFLGITAESDERALEDAIDMQMRAEHDGPTIGLLLCKSKNKVVAEYALRVSGTPIGVAEYQLLAALPASLQSSLPSIEAIEQALMDGAAPAEH
ncbi:MAG: PDDEXK nuclease domain-containing protein [Pseudomonadales bacterium]|nr:PDDEXK nuclease domain-containing protein [Pseudomonadales bacterium]